MADEVGALPLLSAALLELWRGSGGKALRLDGYRSSGGIKAAVARLAEDAYARLDEPGRATARALMLRLVADEEGLPARRRAPLAELEWAAGHRDQLNEVEREFIEAARHDRDRELEQRRKLRGLLTAVGLLLAVATAAAVFAYAKQRSASREAVLARAAARSSTARRLGAEALRSVGSIAVQALRLIDRGSELLVVGTSSLTFVDASSLRVIRRLPIAPAPPAPTTAAASPDGKQVAIGTRSGAV